MKIGSLALSEVQPVIATIIRRRRYDLRCIVQDSWADQDPCLLWGRIPLLVETIPVNDEG